ncbi:MAG: hypothetical protein M5R36_19080 [Deltaproteobacteria bacterium]|nr:hypothetical protein [Deltaproteobacteria bacterium]
MRRPGQTKAPRIRAVLREIRDRYGTITLDALGKQRTPELLDALTAFHGVGKKTAACVALFELGRDVCPVDTHVHRIVKRLGWVSERVSADAAFDELAGRLPAGEAHEAHIALIRHGRTLCRPRPRCRECAVRRLCPSAE